MEFLAAAFILMWVLVLLYVIYMFVRQRALEQELKQLEEMLQERRQQAAKPKPAAEVKGKE